MNVEDTQEVGRFRRIKDTEPRKPEVIFQKGKIFFYIYKENPVWLGSFPEEWEEVPEGVPFTTGLSPAELERLAVLAEECAEVVQAVNKIIRHGYDSGDPTTADWCSNRVVLESELGDVMAAVMRMDEAKDIDSKSIDDKAGRKLQSSKVYMHFQD